MTETLMLASSSAESRAADLIIDHHAELLGRLGALSDALVRAATAGAAESELHRDRLVAWAEDELVPHAKAEESALYPLAQGLPEGRLLIEGMLAEHRTILGLVGELREAATPTEAAAAGRALRAVLTGHVERENELVVPLIAAAPEVSLATALEAMHDELRSHGEDARATGTATGCGGEHACACGEAESAGPPELDARVIPHAIRHATVLGAVDVLAAGESLVLVAPHDPKPLLGQMQKRFDGGIDVAYLQQGPEDWRLLLTRR